MRHVQLDPVGGIAGDMFVAALLDAEPAHAAACLRAAEAVAGVPCRLVPHRDRVLAGARFVVRAEAPAPHHPHVHAAWRDIRARLHAAPLEAAAREHALGIFALLAEAEARVHGVGPEEVTFHEVGAADSLADIVAAACLIAAQGEASWHCAPLPLGSGTVTTAHGELPVPAPAVALLLEGFTVTDDGIGGERVTPTGAAILRHLGAQAAPPPGARRLRASGIGFGARALPGRSNVLRALISEAVAVAPTSCHRELAVIAFEVDDITAEDLAAGLERIRALPGVHDALQMPAYGKKGRMATHVQVLAAPEALETVVAACFEETSTIGLRAQIVQGWTLARSSGEVVVGGQQVRIKRVARPGGVTAKAESDDLAGAAGLAARRRLRQAAERLADD